MKIRLLPSLILVAAIAVACAPVSATDTPEPLPTAPVESTATLSPPSPAQEQPSQPTSGMTEVPAETAASAALPVATSRGSELHATDPTTVNLASGQVQFVEFFRFT